MDFEKIKKFGVIVECQDINSKGSGFIFMNEKYVATNWHVVFNQSANIKSNNIKVKFFNGSEMIADLVTSDKSKDFAVLKIENNLSGFFECGDYESTKAYTDCFFIGKGLDVPEISIHKGWISSKTSDSDINIFQIDGPINKGNSGGPLLNSLGKVIGIISKTEAKFDKELIDLLSFLESQQGRGGVLLMGVNPLEVFKRLIYWTYRNANVGIGYAISIEYIKEAIENLK